MRKQWHQWLRTAGVSIPSLAVSVSVWGASPTADQALVLTPIQKDVVYDRPAAEDVEKCTVDVETRDGASGWVVRGPEGQTLRRFFDTNADNKVDLWCYFKDGIEVYRDVDANFNNKADQYRWLGTAGTRWGLDANEDGRIDSWKTISPEEATAEIMAAIQDQDRARFEAVLLSTADIDGLSLGKEEAADLKSKQESALTHFADAARGQRVVGAKSQWISFGASRPGTIPAGTNGSAADIRVYDNVSAVIETDGKHSQLLIGTLVQVGDTWKAIELPKNLGSELAAGSQGYFFSASAPPPRQNDLPANLGGVSEEVQKLVTELERIDKALVDARTASDQQKLNTQRADVIEKIIRGVTSAEDRGLWTRQYAETIAAAAQTGTFPEGIGRLEKLLAEVQQGTDKDLTAFVKFRLMTTSYNLDVQEPGADFQKIHGNWLSNLEKFVNDYPQFEEVADAKLQLAMGHEFAGDETKAIQFYELIVTDHPSEPSAIKAAGAKRRLQSVGKSISLRGNTLDKRTFDLAQLKGRVVLVQYWATWCEPCKEDMETIRKLQAKYAKAGFQPVGVNLDSSVNSALTFLKAHPLSWPQLYEEGGLESRLANEMGILTLPTMLLIDQNGRVVNRSVMASELDKELEKLLRK